MQDLDAGLERKDSGAGDGSVMRVQFELCFGGGMDDARPLVCVAQW